MSETNQAIPHITSIFALQQPAETQSAQTVPAAAAAAETVPMPGPPVPGSSLLEHYASLPVMPVPRQASLIGPKGLVRPSESEEQVARPRMQSLSLFTAKFLRILRDGKSNVVDLNAVIKELNITKRRLTDVLNVLEGSELIERTDANTVVWIAPFPVTSIPLLKELAEEQTVGQIVPQRDMSNTKKLQVQLHNLTSAIEREKLRLNALVTKAHVVLPKPSDFTIASGDASTRFYFISADRKSFRACAHPPFEDKDPETNESRKLHQLTVDCSEAPLKVQVICKDGTAAFSNCDLSSQAKREENIAKRWKPASDPAALDLFPASQTVEESLDKGVRSSVSI